MGEDVVAPKTEEYGLALHPLPVLPGDLAGGDLIPGDLSLGSRCSFAEVDTTSVVVSDASDGLGVLEPLGPAVRAC
jgi:hypothetical protein